MEQKSESIAAKLARRPGQFAKQPKDRPFLYQAQAQKDAKQSLIHLVNAILELQKEECLFLAGVALTTLDALTGKTAPKNQVARTKLQAKRPAEQLQDVKAMVLRLLKLLAEEAPKALSAEFLLDESKQAAGKREEQKERLHNETIAVIYPFSPIHSPDGIVRLYK